VAEQFHSDERDRRAFLKAMAVYGGTLALGSSVGRLQAAPSADWSNVIGIQLTVVRDEMAKDVESTLAKLAEIGYKAVNPVGFTGIDARVYRAMLDRHGLIAPQIDLGFNTGPTMDKDLESCQILGIKYAEPAMGGGPAGGAGRGAGGRGPGGGGGRGIPPPQTEDMAKRVAAAYNTYGQAAKKFGMKVIYHNHIEHFELLTGTLKTFFDVFLSETDPETVAMEFDLGYTAIAGRKIPETIRQYPGRFPTWDIRDAFGIRNADANPSLTPNERRAYTYAVPVGLGEVDFKTIFASAETAGLKYFFVVQDNAATWGDTMAVARVSFQNLARILA
jgi:sugar phosphate isomerase/epimerase